MSILGFSRFAAQRHHFIPSKLLLFRFSSTPDSSEPVVDYLVSSFNFSRTEALSISNRFRRFKNIENVQSFLKTFQSLGFSETQIRAAVASVPSILFCDVDKILKPKLEFLQEIGLVGSVLSKFISKNANILTYSLRGRLIPNTEAVKSVLSKGGNVPEDLVKVLTRCNWLLCRHPESGLLSNIAYLESCGIVASQLSYLLKRQPSIFITKESRVREIVSVAADMGFSVNSRKLVHAVYTVSCLSKETIRRKLDLIKSYGFSEQECMVMIQKMPNVLLASEDKLKLGIEFFTNTLKLSKSALAYRPKCLLHSIKERAIPRYRVLQLLRSKRLLKKDPSFFAIMNLREDEFFNKFISCFADYAEELLAVYKGHLVDSSEM